MRRIIFAILFLAAAAAHSADQIIATLSVTNAAGTTNGNTIVINGSTRTWTNTVTSSPSTLIQVTNSPSLVTTQMLTHLGTYTPGAGISATYGSSTSIVMRGLIGGALTITVAGGASGWATVAYSTNVYTNTYLVRVPITTETATNRTNIASLLVKAISDYSTNSISTNAPSLTNYLSRGPQQQFVNGPTIFQRGIGGTNTGLTNGTIVTASITNSTFDGGFIGPTNQVEIGQTIVDGTSAASFISFRGSAGLTNANIKASDSGPVLYDGIPGTSTPLDMTVPDDPAVILNFWSAIRIFPNLTSGLYIGTNVWDIQNDWYGSLNIFHEQLGASNFWATGWNLTNGIVRGTNQWHGSIQYPRTATGAIRTGLANTNNYLDAASNAVIYVTGATTIHNFTGMKGGQDGQLVRVRDGCGTDVEIFNLDGSVAAGDRFWLGTGAAKLTLTNRPVYFDLLYNSQSNWWEVIKLNN